MTQQVSAPSSVLKTLECYSRDGVHFKWQKEKLADKTVYPYGWTGINFGLRRFSLETAQIWLQRNLFFQNYTVRSSVPFLFSLH